jgi:glycosyltransferase involved in cell wall biosynthesis
MPRVQVLLSTYNGERYLPQQLQSVLEQDHRDLEILIRDDGSTDRTREVLSGYMDDPRVRIVFGENLGVVRSFFELLRISSAAADYAALCDQDDVWLPDKLSRALRFLEPSNHPGPVIYASRVAVVDEQLKPMKMSRLPSRPLVLGNALMQNLLPGCTMVMNRAACDLVVSRLPAFTFVHDWWIYLVMSACGEIRHDSESRILYRQHAQNTIGIAPNPVVNVQRRLERFFQRKESIVRQVVEFHRLFGDRLLPSQLETIGLIERAPHSVWSRLRLAFSGRVYRQGVLDDLLLRAVIVANRL